MQWNGLQITYQKILYFSPKRKAFLALILEFFLNMPFKKIGYDIMDGNK